MGRGAWQNNDVRKFRIRFNGSVSQRSRTFVGACGEGDSVQWGGGEIEGGSGTEKAAHLVLIYHLGRHGERVVLAWILDLPRDE